MPDHSVYSIDSVKAFLNQNPGFQIPKHVALIMDGNGRWAKKRGLIRLKGHHEGMKSVRVCIETAAKLGVEVLTLYAFSTENWSRPEDEVSGLFKLLRYFCDKEISDMVKNQIRVRFIGRRAELPLEIRETLSYAEERTKALTRMTVLIALNYGSQ